MAPQVLHRVIFGTASPTPTQASRLTIKPALLSHYMRHKVSECDYPAIVPSSGPGAGVRGTYVQGLTFGDQWRLDLFEGDQYSRVKVRPRLLDEDGNETIEVDAETYVWIDKKVELEEGEWNFEEFRREKMSRWVGFDEEYEGKLRPSILGVSFARLSKSCSCPAADVDEAVKKDPTGGRGSKGLIGEKLETKNEPEHELLEAAV